MPKPTRPCEICMKPIDEGRLDTVPETRLCREHAEKIEKFGGEFKVSITVEKTSKQGSLKMNYGGVTPQLKRNLQGIEKLKDEFEEEKWSKRV